MFWIGFGVVVEGRRVDVAVELGVFEESEGVPSLRGLDFAFF